MYIGWTKHIQDEKEKVDFQNSIWGSKRVLDRLKVLIEMEESAIENTERDIKSYDSASWSHKQAHKNGLRQGLSIIKQMVDLDKQQPPKEKE